VGRKKIKSGKKISKTQRQAELRQTLVIIGVALGLVIVIFLFAAGVF